MAREPVKVNAQPDAPALLRQAAALVERALIQLDMREAPCLECGTRHFRNREHAKVYERLTDTPSKLVNTADMLENGPGGFAPITRSRT
jgi:hypothetical protein